jgi:hypothetical protein
VDDFDQVLLRFHHRIDVLVGHRDLADDGLVLAALDAFGRPDLVLYCEQLLRLGAAHDATRTMAAALEALGAAQAAHDVATRTHAAGDDAQRAAPLGRAPTCS